MDSKSIKTKIQAGFYHPKTDFVPHKVNPVLHDAYRMEQKRLKDQFKADALKELGLSDHPKAELLWDKANEHGHGNGYSEVWIYLEDFAELLT